MLIHDRRSEFQGQFLAARPSTKYLVVHHAAANYSPVNGIDDVRAIARYHVQTRGWAGVGYHEVLAESTPGGPIACYVVSNPLSIRAHTWGRNHEAWGITMAADFSKTLPPQKWIDALALRLVEAKRRWPGAQIVGHKDITFKGHETSCPGERWAVWKPALMAQVESMLRQSQPPAVLHTVTAGPHGAIAQEDRRPGAFAARYYPPGAKIVCDDLQSSYWHCADHSGFIANGQVEP